MPYRHVLIVVLVPIIMGFGFVISKPAMEFFPPILLNGLRWSLSGLIMFYFFPFPKNFLKQMIFISFVAPILILIFTPGAGPVASNTDGLSITIFTGLLDFFDNIAASGVK